MDWLRQDRRTTFATWMPRDAIMVQDQWGDYTLLRHLDGRVISITLDRDLVDALLEPPRLTAGGQAPTCVCIIGRPAPAPPAAAARRG